MPDNDSNLAAFVVFTCLLLGAAFIAGIALSEVFR
jgi:hypothetical protein